MILVRDATVSDLEAIIEVGSRMRSESTEYYPPVDVGQIKIYLDACVNLPGIFLGIVAEDGGRVIGMMSAVAGPYSFSPNLRSASDVLYVLPEYRGTLAAKKMIHRFWEWSESLQADCATMSIATGISPERTGRFFEKMGFKPMGTIYQRNKK